MPCYEEALVIVGDAPTWVLRDWVERLPVGDRIRDAASVLLRRKGTVRYD